MRGRVGFGIALPLFVVLFGIDGCDAVLGLGNKTDLPAGDSGLLAGDSGSSGDACVNKTACLPTGNPCHAGAYDCTVSVCVDTGSPGPDGAACGNNMVCESGSCVACVKGAACTPSNPCHVGSLDCSGAKPVCTDTGTPAKDQLACGSNVCCSGACVASDQNCGTCGHSCQGGACSSGVCQPLTLSSTSAVTLAVDSTSVYWCDGSSVLKVPLGGGSPMTLATGPSVQSTGGANALAVNSSGAFFRGSGTTTTPAGVAEVGLAGGVVTMLGVAQGNGGNGTLAIDSADVYWSGYNATNSGTITKVGQGGGSVATLASGLPSPTKIAVGADGVYWVDETAKAVLAVGLGGGSVATLYSESANIPIAIAVDSTSVYFADTGAVISKVPIGGGSVTSLATASCPLNCVAGFALEGTSLYWLDPGGVKEVSVNGGTVTTLFASTPGPQAIAVDATSVYFANGSTLRKLAK